MASPRAFSSVPINPAPQTGLCVYEIDDPALRYIHPTCSVVHEYLTKNIRSDRDDPTVDENTRLRNRIAELESLVRELRGKTLVHLSHWTLLTDIPQVNLIRNGQRTTSAMGTLPKSGIRGLQNVLLYTKGTDNTPLTPMAQGPVQRS